MQIYATDQKGTRVFVESAKKSLNYFCIECGSIMRVRGGPHVQLHFYHIDNERECRHEGKSAYHLEIQRKIIKSFPDEALIEEQPFPEIQRIADVAWPSKKIVFEVQCSSMTGEEARSRIKDYASIGFDVVWIVSDSTFNKRKVSAFEAAISSTTHYYCSSDGMYDQHGACDSGVRVGTAVCKGISIARLQRCATQVIARKEWKWHCADDLLASPQVFAEEVMLPKKRAYPFKEWAKAWYYYFLKKSCQ